eukprot:1155365-Pelagomonas_calceolata.AAC.11
MPSGSVWLERNVKGCQAWMSGCRGVVFKNDGWGFVLERRVWRCLAGVTGSWGGGLQDFKGGREGRSWLGGTPGGPEGRISSAYVHSDSRKQLTTSNATDLKWLYSELVLAQAHSGPGTGGAGGGIQHRWGELVYWR